MTEPEGPVRVLPYGADALLAEVASTAAATGLYAEARAARAEGRIEVVDVVPGARTVLFDGVADLTGLRRWLAGWRPGGAVQAQERARTVEIPTRYDGADLEDVARLWDMTVDEAVTTHAGLRFVVAFCGFSPGFAYCLGVPDRLAVPRLAEPRPRVPAGSVAVADVFTGVYPAASPGGWRLLGRTDLTLWDPAASEPALLAPGTRLRFVPVGSADG